MVLESALCLALQVRKCPSTPFVVVIEALQLQHAVSWQLGSCSLPNAVMAADMLWVASLKAMM